MVVPAIDRNPGESDRDHEESRIDFLKALISIAPKEMRQHEEDL